MASLGTCIYVDFWPEDDLVGPDGKPVVDPDKMATGLNFDYFVQEGSRMEPTYGQIWPR